MFGYVVSLYEKDSGRPGKTEGAETWLEAVELQYQFQDIALDSGELGVIITEGYYSTSQGSAETEGN